MAPPSQQKIGQEWNKQRRQQNVGQSAGSAREHIGPVRHLPHAHDIRRFRGADRLARLLELFRLLPEGLQNGADFLRILRNVVGKNNGLIVRRRGDAVDHRYQCNHTDQRRQGSRNVQILQRLHHRREHKTQQNGKEQHRQHRLAVIREHNDQADAQQRQRPVMPASCFRGLHTVFLLTLLPTGQQFCLTAARIAPLELQDQVASTIAEWIQPRPSPTTASSPSMSARKESESPSPTRWASPRRGWIPSSVRTSAAIWRPWDRCWQNTKSGKLWSACPCA